MVVDKNQKGTQVVYRDTAEWVNETIAGNTFAERLETMRKDYTRTHDKRYYNIILVDILTKLGASDKDIERLEKGGT